MDSFKTGTLSGAGTFRCESCGFAVALQERDTLPACPHCRSARFSRSSMFAEHAQAEPWGAYETAPPEWLPGVREDLSGDGDHLAYREDGEDGALEVVDLEGEWTRIGRSGAADVQLDDPTVSRRHALLHRTQGSVRLLDDRSLNGVFVNGERVESHVLVDGDQVAIGRFHLYFVTSASRATGRFAAHAGVEHA